MKTLADPILDVGKFSEALLAALADSPDEQSGAEMQREAESSVDDIFAEEPELIEHFWIRFRAFLMLLGHKDVAPFLNFDLGPETMRFHPALVCAAATMKVSRNGLFPRKSLLDLAYEYEEKDFHDWEWNEP